MKRILSLALALAMMMSLLAVIPAASADDLEHVTLKIIFPGDKKSATDEVWNTIAEKYADQLNADFEVQFIPLDDYAQKLLVMAGAGESWDLNFDSNWTGYYNMKAQEAYMDLSELLPKYAPHLYETYQASGALAAATDNEGRVTALPWTMSMNNRTFFQWRGDLITKADLGIKPEDINTTEDVLELCRALKAAYPDKYILENVDLGVYLMKYDLFAIDNALVIDLNDPTCQVQFVEDTAAYKERAELAKLMQDEGIIWGDVLTDKRDHNDLINEGMLITKWGTHEFSHQNRAWVEEDAYWDYNDLYVDNKYANRTPLANAMCIPDTSDNPERVLMFMDLLETDGELYDLVHYGILGKTYELTDEGEAVFPEGMNGSNSNYMEWIGRWGLWKPQFMRPDFSYGAGFWAEEAAYAASNPNNVINPLDGFSLNMDAINIEIAQRNQIYDDAEKVLAVGLVDDVDAVIAKLQADQKAAGRDKVLAEVQRQIDEYLGN
ncbi:MAG: extracellular solute-binding protein [Clostridia bacterium]|nr:extracellular solute-binding protein [Clostridia bacterium]